MSDNERRGAIAVGCRILAREGLAIEALGHISTRTADGSAMWLRCRAPHEFGIETTTKRQVRRVALDTNGGSTPDGFSIPLEYPIHAELLRLRPDANAVVHVHPKYIVLCAAAGVKLRPIYGSFDWSGANLLSAGIGEFNSARLINNRDIAGELAEAMDGKDVCVMRGHGATVLGPTVEVAVLKAIGLERLAWFCWQMEHIAAGEGAISDDDLAWYEQNKDVVGRTASKGTWESYAQHVMPIPALWRFGRKVSRG